jgi:cytochrome P450
VPRGTSPYLPPITLDPPDTSRYRAVLNPSFTKRKVAEVYEQRTRALTVELIEGMKPHGRCEFVREFARVMPVSVFLSIIDLPVERREEFLSWGAGMSDPATRSEYEHKIAAYLAQILDQRATEPGDDLLSEIAGWRKNPRFRNESEVVGMAMLVFSGGLDTVAAALSFAMHELGRRPELQARLREDPAVIPAAIDEFLRRNAVASTARLVKQKCERKGACFMPGDMVMVPVALSGMDERLYDRALEVDFDRGPVAHNTFGNGPHRCIGEHLARMELRVFFEEWFGRMPEVRIDPASRPWSHGGSVEGMSSLELTWDP